MHEAEAEGGGGGLRAIHDLQLEENALHVRLHRFGADGEQAGDLFVRAAKPLWTAAASDAALLSRQNQRSNTIAKRCLRPPQSCAGHVRQLGS